MQGSWKPGCCWKKGLVTVLAGSNDQTINKALDMAKRYQKEVMIDLIDCSRKVQRIKELVAIGANFFCLHRPSDISLKKKLLFPERDKIPGNCKIAVAGGIGLSNIDEVVEYKPEVVIIGSAVTESADPRSVLTKIKNVVKGRGN